MCVHYLHRPVKFPFKAVWSGRALSACHWGQRFIRTAALRPPRRAQELKHMRKLNWHPNSLAYTKQFKWYSLERWQVLMSLSVLWRGRERLRDRVRGWRTLFFFLTPSVFCQLCCMGTEAWRPSAHLLLNERDKKTLRNQRAPLI